MMADALIRLGSWIAIATPLVGAAVAWQTWNAIPARPTDGELSDRMRASLWDGKTDLNVMVGELIPLGTEHDDVRAVFYQSAFHCGRDTGLPSSGDGRIVCSRSFMKRGYGSVELTMIMEGFSPDDPRTCGWQVSTTIDFTNNRVSSTRTSSTSMVCK